ncbi:flagellar hook-length control protein FliK [Alterisphingorhabdus coralli]|uniref:Flagellar hook-length control protein FliK n=1 Tax=Alterisphingorhabdus coralli TaxID=3071408 RepID=A0AA97F960_9SPHN|nr:flagellar hook-length control protein FliK [Parasphingorhabdus sp. SCSIO 66989]WOE74770.1 flagellar hook-length control protein FliK [Parasphingorhabdus sp. SCSIO 66989]
MELIGLLTAKPVEKAPATIGADSEAVGFHIDGGYAALASGKQPIAENADGEVEQPLSDQADSAEADADEDATALLSTLVQADPENVRAPSTHLPFTFTPPAQPETVANTGTAEPGTTRVEFAQNTSLPARMDFGAAIAQRNLAQQDNTGAQVQDSPVPATAEIDFATAEISAKAKSAVELEQTVAAQAAPRTAPAFINQPVTAGAQKNVQPRTDLAGDSPDEDSALIEGTTDVETLISDRPVRAEQTVPTSSPKPALVPQSAANSPTTNIGPNASQQESLTEAIDMAFNDSMPQDDGTNPVQQAPSAPLTSVEARVETPNPLPFQPVSAASPATEMRAATTSLPQANTPIAFDNRFADRIAQEVAMISKTDRGISLQVTPERLGTINIEIMQGANGDTVRMTAEDADVRQIIAQAQSRIEQEMRQAGQKLSSFEVAGGDVSDSAAQQQFGDQREAGSLNDNRPSELGYVVEADEQTDQRQPPIPGDTAQVRYA